MRMRGSLMKKAFTLAEVLITLVIVGVIAALTIPLLVQKYQNMVVENKLKKFYSVMQQAIKMSEAENGELQYWYKSFGSNHSAEVWEWYEKYLGKYIRSVKIEANSKINKLNNPIVYLPDGSAFTFSAPSRDIVFYTQPGKCDEKAACTFKFILRPFGFISYGQGNTIQELRTKCLNPEERSNCSGYIHINGWKIPNDYPLKVR